MGFLLFPAAFSWGDLPELRVAAYDSLLAKKGALTRLIPEFEKECQCRLRTFPSGDAAQLVSRVEMDLKREKPFIHVAVGADQILWERAKLTAEPWGQWKPQGWDLLLKDLQGVADFLPFDQGVFAWMMDTQKLKALHLAPPKNLKELLHPSWKKNLILEDPRTSSPGLSFILFTHQVFGKTEGWEKFWQSFRGQWLTLTPGWDAAYGLFLKEEAPLVWSYLTSQAYHREHGDSTNRYQALVLEEGNPVQVEGAWLVKKSFTSATEKDLAKKFLEFLIRPAVQVRLAHDNWMMPVLRKGMTLPESYQDLPSPKRRTLIKYSAQEVDTILGQWKRMISQP